MRLALRLFPVWLAVAGMAHLLCWGRYPAPGGDDAWFSVTAYSLLQEGRLARSAIPGRAGFHEWDFAPPLIITSMWLAYKTVGFGVMQTKFVSILCGAFSAIFVGLGVHRATRDASAGRVATLVFLMNPVMFGVLQLARYETPVVLASAAICYLASAASTRSTLRSCLVGICCGLMGVAYYPFAPLGAGILVLSSIWPRASAESPGWSRTAASLLGFATVWGLFLLYIARDLQMFQKQIFSLYDDYGGRDVGAFLRIASAEHQRYLRLAKQLGPFHLLLAGLLLAACFDLKLNRTLHWAVACVWASFAYLAFYGQKDPRYLAAPFVWEAFAAGLLAAAVRKGMVRHWLRRSFGCVLGAIVILSCIQLGVAGGTAMYQWQGRDYRRLQLEIRSAIPAGARVIGPLTAWYALAGYAGRIHLYTQAGGKEGRAKGEEDLNDPQYLAPFDFVIIQEPTLVGGRLAGLRQILDSEFAVARRVRLPFRPLPWARTAPYEMDIYTRRVDH